MRKTSSQMCGPDEFIRTELDMCAVHVEGSYAWWPCVNACIKRGDSGNLLVNPLSHFICVIHDKFEETKETSSNLLRACRSSPSHHFSYWLKLHKWTWSAWRCMLARFKTNDALTAARWMDLAGPQTVYKIQLMWQGSGTSVTGQVLSGTQSRRKRFDAHAK